MRKLFLSFSALLLALKDGRVIKEDLDVGLFYLGCSRSHVFTDLESSGNPIAGVFGKAIGGVSAQYLILAALTRGEIEGRVIWRESGAARNTIQQLNELLVRNGYRPAEYRGAYAAFEAGESAKRAGNDLEVVYV